MTAALITGPVIVFLIFVAPLWLFLHYRSKKKSQHGLSTEEYEKLQNLSAKAEQLQQRITTLEKILDSESPSWRRDYGK